MSTHTCAYPKNLNKIGPVPYETIGLQKNYNKEYYDERK